VARPFRFVKSIEDGLHTYRYCAEDGPFERSWLGLEVGSDWSEAAATHSTPLDVWAVGSAGEEVALYLAFAWRISAGTQGLPNFRRFVIPRFHRVAGMYAAGEPYAMVNWEHQVDELGTNTNDCAIRGFVPARSLVRLGPEPGPWERENADRAGLFEVFTFAQLKTMMRMLDDATATINLFAPRDERLDRGTRTTPRSLLLAQRLMADGRPRMADLLEPGELFIDLTVGFDPGYTDMLVIQSPVQIEDRLDPLVAEYETAIERYERELDSIASVAEFNQRLGQLVGIEPPQS